MSNKCEICGKGPLYGNNVSRLGHNAIRRRIKARTNRRFLPNLQVGRVEIGGKVVRAKVCTRCLKAHPATS